MSLTKLYTRIDWENNTTPAINETNLNLMSKAIDDIDDRVIELGDDVLEYVPEIISKYTEIQTLSENPPYIGANNNWYVFDTDAGSFVDSGVSSLGNGIASIAKTSTAGLVDTYTITFEDGQTSTFTVTNGDDGNGISSIAKTSTSGLVDTYTITFTDSTTTTFTVTNGSNISSISKTSTSGLTDTYTVTLTDGSTSTFTVTNGNGIASIALTSGTHAAGTLDTYTITYTDGTTSTFQVYNGADGSGSGDMQAATYDANSDVANAGGIAAYVTANSVSAVTGASGTSDGQVQVGVTKNGSTTTTDMSVTGWDKLVGAWTSTVTGAVGATTVSFTNPWNTASVAVDPFCENSSGTPIAITAQTVTSSTITLTFAELTESTDFKCLVRDLS